MHEICNPSKMQSGVTYFSGRFGIPSCIKNKFRDILCLAVLTAWYKLCLVTSWKDGPWRAYVFHAYLLERKISAYKNEKCLHGHKHQCCCHQPKASSVESHLSFEYQWALEEGLIGQVEPCIATQQRPLKRAFTLKPSTDIDPCLFIPPSVKLKWGKKNVFWLTRAFSFMVNPHVFENGRWRCAEGWAEWCVSCLSCLTVLAW